MLHGPHPVPQSAFFSGSILDVPPRAFQRPVEHEKRREDNQVSQQTASSSGHRFDSEVTHTTNAIPMTPNRSQQWLSLHPNVSGTPGLASNSPCIEDVPLPPFSSVERHRNQPRPMRGNGPGVPPLFPDFMMPVSHREVARMAKEKRVPYRAPSPRPHEQTASHVAEQSSAGSARRSRRVDDMVEDEDAPVAGPSTRDTGVQSSVGPVRQPRRTRGRGKKSANTSARKPRRK
ncbi:hypothetical protein C2E23DRAFT_833778 [Lenzites betulinus]|nr:hypothetical protein C2E23DRAFT_833778 [Lenzites betulinus]